MAVSRRLLERVFLGRALRTDRLGDTLLPKRLGMPVFASDALSSVAYAPDEVVLTLALAGGAAVLTHSIGVTVAVTLVIVVVIASYRQNVHAYPSGGGDYEVATVNLGPTAGLGVGAALMVDYVLTVAVSVSAGVQNAGAALGFLRGNEAVVATGLVALLALVNLRGVRESGRALALPVYAFLLAIAVLVGTGLMQWATGTLDRAPSAAYELVPAPGYEAVTALGLSVLLVRAFASGTVALTGVQGVANGVPALRRPKSANAATILLVMSMLSISILLTVVWLVNASGIQLAMDPQQQLRLDGRPVGESYVQDPVLGQLSTVVFGPGSLGVLLVSICTGVMLVVAANTAFSAFPQLAARLARDGYLPSLVLRRGARLVYSNAVLLLAGVAAVLVLVYRATVTELVQMYLVGVFISFTLSQLGMVRHWNAQLRLELGLGQRRRMLRSRTINTIGVVVCTTVLLVVLLTRFADGAGLALLGIASLWMVMTVVDRVHQKIASQTALPPGQVEEDLMPTVPSQVTVLVHLHRLDRPALRAIAYARATRPQLLEAVTVDVAPERTAALREQWARLDVPVTLRFLESPYREAARPVVDYVRRLRQDRPRDIVVVYLPEYVSTSRLVGWFRDRSQDRLRQELLRTPGVVVATVPWQEAQPEPAARVRGH